MELDEIDQRIVALLRENARRSFQDIGGRVSLERPGGQAARRPARGRRASSAATRRRSTRRAGLDDARRRRRSSARGGCPAREIRAACGRHPEVAGAYTVAGEASAILHLHARDTEHLEEALERLRDTPGITRTQTQVVLSTLFERPVA